MSGIFTSTGRLTNEGKQLSDINNYLNLIIKDLTIHIIPLSTKTSINIARGIGGVLKCYIPSIYHPSLTHIAIQLNLEKSEDIAILEYGQYYSEESDLKKKNLFISSSSSNVPKENHNENLYYYINKDNINKDKRDGARLTIFTNNFLDYAKSRNVSHKYEDISEMITDIIACQYYDMPINEYYQKKLADPTDFQKVLNNIFNSFHRVDCYVENKINLQNLINGLKGEKWIAQKYNVVFHNCQNFGAEIIKILKAKRKDEFNKVRVIEKTLLPSCIISALWHNENLSLVNTLGRIPIFGLFHDIVCSTKLALNEDKIIEKTFHLRDDNE